MTDAELMRVRFETDYIFDERGRMLRSNSPDALPAPRLLLGRTASSNVFRLGHQVPEALASRLTGIIEREPVNSDLRASPAGLDALRSEMAAHAPIEREGGGPAYRFPDALTRSHEVIAVSAPNNAHVARDTFPWVLEPGWQPCFAVVRDGVAVSVCFSSRLGRQAAEAGVETLPEFRGRGYAAAVTSAWGEAIRRMGLIPLYSTSWDNRASQGVAHRVGLIMFGSDMHWA